MLTVLNTNENLNHLEQPMFFGEGLGIARFESQRHAVFDKLTEKQLSFFWRPEEVDLATDKIDYATKLTPAMRVIFDSNLQYQSLLDTVQGRAPTQAFLDIVSDTSLENWITTWAFSETIHSRSYTHIERNLHIDPSVEFDKIMKNKAIMKRTESITGFYDSLLREVHTLKNIQIEMEKLGCFQDMNENCQHLREKYNKQRTVCKEALYLCMHAVNALEAIRFYVSFSFTFNFANNMNLMEGNAKIMRLIARDEALHQKSTQSIIRLWQMGKDDPEMADIAVRLADKAAAIFVDVVNQEIEWAEHLFTIGDVEGVSLKSTVAYILHLADQRMRAVGLASPYGITPNPYPWMNKWLKSDDVQVAPQEVEVSAYLSGNLNTAISDQAYADWQKRFMPRSQQVQV
ncbi:ribonucleotide-diphosphate reductase beta subunit [Pantoea phage Phynn]|nr:ribonucleotide-diphosphate reductase beta subunit [Pantoea phage Phynn]